MQVWRHLAQPPVSMKNPSAQLATHLLLWRRREPLQERQSDSVDPVQVSQVEWQGRQCPLSEYSAAGGGGGEKDIKMISSVQN